jgi:hypothetical protein
MISFERIWNCSTFSCFWKFNRDKCWKLSFYFHYYWIQWTRQKYWNFFQIYINFSAVFCEQNFGIFYLVDKSKIFKFTIYFTNYFWLKVWFLYLRLIWDVRWESALCWSSVCFITMAFSRLFFLIRIRVG